MQPCYYNNITMLSLCPALCIYVPVIVVHRKSCLIVCYINRRVYFVNSVPIKCCVLIKHSNKILYKFILIDG